MSAGQLERIGRPPGRSFAFWEDSSSNVRNVVDVRCATWFNYSMTYRIALAPKFAGMTAFDCAFCGHHELGKPVFLTDGGNTIAAGSGCASVALYGHKDRRSVAAVRREVDALEHAARVAEELRADRRRNYAIALETLRADLDCPYATNARRTFHALGGLEVLGPFPAWVATVAATGDLRPAE